MDIFEVATEFKFEAGQAILNTDALKDSVDNLSKAADSALGSLNYLASGFVAHLGFGSGGLLSVLTQAVQISEQFNQSSLMFANNISSNFGVLAGDIHTFNDRLETSKQIMGTISSTAIKFGINTGDLARMTQLIATPLANRGKLGTNYGNAISMSKNLMLGSEAVGLNPQVASESLYRALTDHMPIHGALFSRMVNTPAFKESHIGTQSQIANMNVDKKIDLLAKSLSQLAGDTDWLNNRIMSIDKQFIILKDEIAEILRPIGDAIKVPLQKMLKMATSYLGEHGKDFGNKLAALIGNVFQDPESLFVNLMQIKRLGADVKKAFEFTGLIQTLVFLKWALGKIGIEFNGGLLKRGFSMLVEGLSTLVGWLWRSGAIGKIFSYLGEAVMSFLGTFAPLLFFFQIISRAIAIAHLEDLKAIPGQIEKFAEVMGHLKDAFARVMLPITLAIDGVAQMIAPLFEVSNATNIAIWLIDKLAMVLDFLGKGITYVMAAFSGLTNMIIGMMFAVDNLQNPFKGMTENFKEGYQDFMTKHPFNQDPSKNVVNQVTNIGKVEARFDMREQMEPDRIAFAVTTHLKKLAMNPTQGRGQSTSTGFGSPAFAGNR